MVMGRTLAEKNIFISGGSRGIGSPLRCGRHDDGANVTNCGQDCRTRIGTIYTAARQIEEAGGQALPLVCDIRDEEQVEAAVAATVKRFGGIDICLTMPARCG